MSDSALSSHLVATRELYDYTRWANDRLLAMLAPLSDDELARDLGSSHGSVLGTLAHLAMSDWIWLERWHGTSPDAPPAWDTSSLSAVVREWTMVQDARATFVNRLDEAELQRRLSYRNLAGDSFDAPLIELLRHVVNHSTYHRGQLVGMIRQVGHPAVATDLVAWYRQR